MRLIFDTHILLWSLTDDDRLPSESRRLLTGRQHQKFASVVSLWEIAIKHARNRGRANDMPISAEDARIFISEAGLHSLPVREEHVIAIGRLALDRHADPFDRMLVAQAIAEQATLVTSDKALAAYGGHVLVV